ncbi:hypothetical protein DYB32_008860 [Aphanomyces invadans]|uniref:Uncharacterized protein n=1 Tax=Aphanomyces invadans TaxID=157072 RepID=A0A418AKH6_9STRA|nr:hypothetical protein DYB32_008860 [Aphanomyces invadans]
MSPTASRSPLVLTDTNWNLWRTAFRGRLLVKGLMHAMKLHSSLMTEDEMQTSRSSTASEKTYTAWKVDNQKGLGLLIEMIDPTQYHQVVDVETCFHAYKQLENHHEPSTKVDRIALMAEYHAIKWNPKQETLQAFLERFDILLRKLQAALVTHQINAKPRSQHSMHVLKTLLEAEYQAALASKEILAPNEASGDERALSATPKHDNMVRKVRNLCRSKQRGETSKRGSRPQRRSNGDEQTSSLVDQVYMISAAVVDDIKAMDDDIQTAFSEDTWCALAATVAPKQVVVDSGASMHMTNSSCHLTNVQACDRRVVMANGTVSHATQSGNLALKTSFGTQMVLNEVLVVDGMPMTLMSVPALLRSNDNCEVTFKRTNCTIKIDGKPIATASTNSNGKVYVLDGHQMTPETASASITTSKSTLWHQRIGHIPIAALKKCAEAGLGVPTDLSTNTDSCIPCATSKMHKVTVPKVATHKYNPRESWVSDSKGPIRCHTRNELQGVGGVVGKADWAPREADAVGRLV